MIDILTDTETFHTTIYIKYRYTALMRTQPYAYKEG